jgi:hypothetical protein
LKGGVMMHEERQQILAMLEAGKLSPEQADALMAIIEEPEIQEVSLPSAPTAPAYKHAPGPKRTFGAQAGFSAQEIIEMGIHGVDPSFVRDMRARFGELGFNQVLEMAIHGIKPDFVDEVRSLNLGELSWRDIVEMGIHGVDVGFIKELQQQEIANLGIQEIIQFAIHGIDVDFIKQISVLEGERVDQADTEAGPGLV